jgi:hypothetical protein
VAHESRTQEGSGDGGLQERHCRRTRPAAKLKNKTSPKQNKHETGKKKCGSGSTAASTAGVSLPSPHGRSPVPVTRSTHTRAHTETKRMNARCNGPG